MDYQLYLDRLMREYYKSTIESFHEIFHKRIYPNFENIEEESETLTEEYYKKLGELPGDDNFDMSDAAEIAQDKGISYYMELRLVKYQLTAMSITSLYHLWEQQLRKFLFDEISHNVKLEFISFCPNGYRQMVNLLNQFEVNIISFDSFPQLDELRLLSNTIKHGDGSSARALKEIKPDLFRQPEFDITIDLPLDSTLLEENMHISENDFNRYSVNLSNWWDEFPEQSFCTDLRL